MVGSSGLGLGSESSTSDAVRQVGNPTKRGPLQGDMDHLTDDLRVHVPGGQHHLGCARDVVGDAFSCGIHAGLKVGELVPVFEPLQGDVSGGEAVGRAGEAHCLPRCGPRPRAQHHRGRGLGYKGAFIDKKCDCNDHH